MLDTHIEVALYEGRTAGLSAATKRAIDRDAVSISPAVVLELELLHEIGRLRVGGAMIARHLGERLAIRIAGERFADVVVEALALGFHARSVRSPDRRARGPAESVPRHLRRDAPAALSTRGALSRTASAE